MPSRSQVWAAIRQFFVVSVPPRVAEERSRAIAERATIANWIAVFVVAITIVGYNLAFQPDQLVPGLLIVAAADSLIVLMILAARQGWFAREPDLQFVLLLGVICNAAEAAQLVITGGPTHSSFLFPYFLLYFGMAILLPSRLTTVVLIAMSLPIGFFASGVIAGDDIGGEAFLSSLFLLLDYAVIAVVANRLMTAIFVREVQSRLDLEAANEQLRELDRLKSELFANVSHELRTPLTLILGPASSLEAEEPGDLNDEQRTLVGGIHRNASRLLALINDFLLQARLDSGQLVRQRKKVDIAKTVRAVETAMRGQARSLDLTLECHIGDDVGVWYGDPQHLERVLINLTANACKFTQPGGRITIDVKFSGAPVPSVLITVSDTGIGIAKDHLEGLFDRFVQVESAANRRFEGTGIGLSIVRELVEFHDGEVWVESEVGKGSSFYVRLPVGTPSPVQVDAREDAVAVDSASPLPLSRRASGEEGRETSGRPGGAEIVLVEDNPDLLEYLVQELGRLYRVRSFTTAQSALQYIETEGCDLILSDIMLPVEDGIEFARRVRARVDMQEIPILLMSARDDVDTKLEGFAAGVDDFVPKPFHLPELRARIRAHLRIRSQAQQLKKTVGDLQTAMEQLKQAEASLLHAEKMALLGLVVAGVAHEINNPLHFLKGNLSLLRSELGRSVPPDRRNSLASLLDDLGESLQRIEAVTSQLTRYGRADSDGASEVELRPLLDAVIRMLKGRAGDGVRFELNVDDGEVVYTSPQALFQIALNVVHNAIQAVDPEHGLVRVESSSSNGATRIRFIDNGSGIPEDVLPHIFEPFYTTKAAGQGTGLGLAIVQNLTASNNGEIELESEPGKGTIVSVRFPRTVQ